jgi:uncharacterized damage-inducible protein DinB
MNAAYFQALFDYACWSRDRIFQAMAGVGDETYAAPNGFTYGSIRAVLTHCLGAEAGWFASLRGEPRPGGLSEEALPGFGALVARWHEEEAKIRGYLAGLSDADLDAGFSVRRRGAEPLDMPVWQVLSHVLNHGAQHRADAAEMLTAIGRSPGDLDLIFFFFMAKQDR